MYQTPQLVEVGKVQDVIMGIFSVGDDLDGFIYPPELDFTSDSPEQITSLG